MEVLKKYKNIQEIADAGIFGYNSRTTKLIKNSMQSNLQSAASDAKISGAANPKATVDNDGDVDDEGDDPDKNMMRIKEEGVVPLMQ